MEAARLRRLLRVRLADPAVENYFNYFAEIEEQLLRSRAGGGPNSAAASRRGRTQEGGGGRARASPPRAGRKALRGPAGRSPRRRNRRRPPRSRLRSRSLPPQNAGGADRPIAKAVHSQA